MTYMFILKCALKLGQKNILYYDARSEKHQIKYLLLYGNICQKFFFPQQEKRQFISSVNRYSTIDLLHYKFTRFLITWVHAVAQLDEALRY